MNQDFPRAKRVQSHSWLGIEMDVHDNMSSSHAFPPVGGLTICPLDGGLRKALCLDGISHHFLALFFRVILPHHFFASFFRVVSRTRISGDTNWRPGARSRFVAQALLPVSFLLHSQEWLCHF